MSDIFDEEEEQIMRKKCSGMFKVLDKLKIEVSFDWMIVMAFLVSQEP